ncbi:MAG: spheroidene monooxygenase [Parafilimonas sp.]
MFCTLIIARYPKYSGVFGFLSMMFFRLPLYFNKRIQFYKLMGSGKNGTFDIHPDLNQWALLFTAANAETKAPGFIDSYLKFFNCDLKEFLLQPIEGFGLWDKKKVFGELPKQTDHDGPIAVLTRATINLNRLKSFWNNVDGVSKKMSSAQGLIMSYGIGEVPWIKQATFSIWQNKEAMKNFAYKMQQHTEVIKKTRNENWYKEELFVRFRIVSIKGFSKSDEAKMLILQPQYEEA